MSFVDNLRNSKVCLIIALLRKANRGKQNSAKLYFMKAID